MPLLPTSTYRLQFNRQFTFKQAADIVPYLHQLGITHVYCSPLLQAKAGSPHCYDIIDHSHLNTEIGSLADFDALVIALRAHRMGVILDIVPNHMYVHDEINFWWNDVLENGPSSPYADYFDIDWQHVRPKLVDKVLLPLLEQQYGEALESQLLKVTYRHNGFFVEIPGINLPTDPCSWTLILAPVVEKIMPLFGETDPCLLELQSILTAIGHLPAATNLEKEKIAERLREKEVIKRRLKTLIEANEIIKQTLMDQCTFLNGVKDDLQSFDDLERFLDLQPYRLSSWRVANDEINYRRFFDTFELAGLRTERKEVFEAIHAYIFSLIEQGVVDGVRVDHIDGLWDPEQYLVDFQTKCVSKVALEDYTNLFYIIGEKILLGNEKLHSEWLISGTVGYDFLNQVNGIFVFQPNRKAIQDIYQGYTDVVGRISEHVYASKKLILNVSMSSELHVLSRALDRISAQHRSSRDFTSESLRAGLRDTCACFPVYRSYISGRNGVIHDEDRAYIAAAINRAKRLNPAISSSIFDFLYSVLLLEHPKGISDEQKIERVNFVMRFQQLTGPVMAKGVEDTAFYRYYPLSSLNEVGADYYSFGMSVDAFHEKNIERLHSWPYSFTTTSTHDTKRSEDVRARINVLSEIPELWRDALCRWAEINRHHRSQEGDDLVPDNNEEYLLYQTLIGSWPLHPMDSSAHLQYMNRIMAYMEKALKEAKINTSWISPNKLYDQKVKQFIEGVLGFDQEQNPFLADFKEFMPKVVLAGMLNSLNQLLLKITSPGVSDIYQGNEIWDLSLVDPDNRKSVDFENRQYLLRLIQESRKKEPKEFLQQMMLHPEDSRIKLFVTEKALQARKEFPDVFIHGSYFPLKIVGEKQNHIIAFGRLFGNKAFIVIATRFFISLLSDSSIAIDPGAWKNTKIVLSKELSSFTYQDLFSQQEVVLEREKEEISIDVEKVLQITPFALLESCDE